MSRRRLAFLFVCLIFGSCGGGGGNSSSPTPPDIPIPDESCPINTNTGFAKAQFSAEAPRILVFSATAGYRHQSIGAGQSLLQNLAANNGWRVDLTEDASEFNASNLANYRVVVWLNTTGDVLNASQQSAFEDYIENGGGYVGIHSAADTEYDWAWYGDLVGAWFASHPAIQDADINVENREHPATAHLQENWSHRDEWYNYLSNPRAEVNVLLSLVESTYEPGEGAMGDHPIAWYHRVGAGRAFYTGLGHTSAAYSDSNFVQHIEGALVWAGRMDKNVPQWEGPPPPDSDFSTLTLASGINEPMALEISTADELFIIGRRGEFYAMENGALQEKSLIPVNSTNEGGLIGFALAPDFEESRQIYFHYTSASSAEHVVSRMTLNTDNSLDFSSELELLRYAVELECCHVAGDLAFDAEGNLYIATGDNTDPFASEGYTPIDERSGRAQSDAQRSAANSNDLRGKILRITPQTDGTYSIPEGNLFNADSLHRGEIYSMGHRNPFRIHVDPQTGWLYWGDIGADAGGSDPGRGPGGIDEINRTLLPGNFGWPYFTGENQPYIDYDFATQTSGAAFDPQSVENLSPNNSGASTLPPALPAWIAVSHRALMVADVYHWNPDIEDEYKLPAWFHERLLYWNFNNDRLYEVSTLEDQPTPRRWLNTSALDGIIDAEISPLNHRLYLLGYGGNCCNMPADAGMLVEVRYEGDGSQGPNGDSQAFEPGATLNLSIDGRVLSANASGPLSLVDTPVGNNEIFALQEAGDGAVALRSVSSGLYLSASNEGENPLRVDATEIGEEERFEYVHYADGSASLKALVNCRYLTVNASDQLVASASTVNSNTAFQLSFAQACENDDDFGLPCREETPAYLNFPETLDSSFSGVPTLLSQTGAFSDLISLTPEDHMLPYDVISPLWSDRAEKQRWFSVPSGQHVDFAESGAWNWPAGTVFVKHFSLPTDENNPEIERRLETRFIVVQEGGSVYGLTYKWREDNSDAGLLSTAQTEDISIASPAGSWTQTWTWPGPEDCLVCHNPEAGYVLGVKTAALNMNWLYPSGVEDNQLRTLINLGLFSEPLDAGEVAALPAHAALDDSSQSAELRLRSYQDINCGNCHGPQGIAAHWDARFATPLAMQGIVNGTLADQRDYFADYGLSNPFVVDPGNPENSILYIRSASESPEDRMPPLGRALAHDAYLELLEGWIENLE